MHVGDLIEILIGLQNEYGDVLLTTYSSEGIYEYIDTAEWDDETGTITLG